MSKQLRDNKMIIMIKELGFQTLLKNRTPRYYAIYAEMK